MIDFFSVGFGILLFLFIYHFFVFIGRRKDYSNLAYSFYCLAIANLVISRVLDIKYDNFIFDVYYILSVHVMVGLFTSFSYFLFKIKKDKYIKKILIFYALFSVLFLILFIIFIILRSKIIFDIYFLLLSIYGIFCLIYLGSIYILKKEYKEKKISLITIAFLSLILFLVIYSILLLFKIRIPNIILFSVYLANAVFFAVALTSNFNREHRDLIELKNNLEKKVELRTEELEESHEQKINFFINLVHETKTPLTLLLNYLDKDIKDRGLSKNLEVAKKNADKLKNDMINFLDMDKFQKGQLLYKHDQVLNISKVLKGKLIQFEDVACKKKIKLKWNLKENLYIIIDPSAMDRIINNLLENVIKYTEENGLINVYLKELNNEILLEISDTGIGISKEQQRHIFKPYYQISHKKQNIQGIGMGLNIVNKIIQEINGTINLESEKGKGTKFKLFFQKYMKVDDESMINDDGFNTKLINNIEENSKVINGESNKKKNILIIEDNREMRQYLQECLLDHYNIFTAENGQEGLDKLKKYPKINLIISDIMMDVMDGYEFFDVLKSIKEYQHIPLIFLTAKNSVDEKLMGLKKGAVDYIYKPFLIREVLNKINSILEIQEKQKKVNIEEFGIKFSKLLRKEVNNKYKNNFAFNSICSHYKVNVKEKEIIKLVINGDEYKEISSKLNISVNVVRNRLHQIYKKFNVKNKLELLNVFQNI